MPPPPGVLLRARHWVNWPVVRTVFFFTWFDHLQNSLSYKEVQLKKFCLPVKTSCSTAENVNETHTLPPPPSPPSLTPVPLTRHYDKYSINPAWSAATYWRAFILTACTKEVNLPICISLHLPCAPFWGPLITSVLSGHI